MKLLFSLYLSLLYFSANADFLIVKRTGNLRESPTVNSEMLEKIKSGDTLILLLQNQVAGYYRVFVPASSQKGWVYRTLVKKIGGDLEIDVDTTGTFDENAVVEIRVLDVGAGLCNLIKLPGDKYVIYDAGGDALTNGNRTLAQIREYIPAGSAIELFVISHTDADHIVAAEQVIRNYRVKKVLWGGYEGSMISGNQTEAYRRLIRALRDHPATQDVNLNKVDSTLEPGSQFAIGNAIFTFLCGFGKPPPEWNLHEKGELLNSVSIVMKLEYATNSVLFCGDAVGRHRDDEEDALIATEKFLVENASQFLKSTVIIAPHHGARNGSSRAFTELVEPEAVIFSAGHRFFHPATRTADQFLHFVERSHIYRTDRGDDEGGTEWEFTRILGCRDGYGDDNIQIQLRSNRSFRVFYVNNEGSCISN